MGYWSKETRRAYYIRNADTIKAKARLYRQLRPDVRLRSVRKNLEKLNDLVYPAKDRPCMDCGNSFPLCAMQFDHVRGEKAANIAVLRSRGNRAAMIEEIAKCDVVCANCHAIRTCLRDKQYKARRCFHEVVKVGGSSKDALPEMGARPSRATEITEGKRVIIEAIKIS